LGWIGLGRVGHKILRLAWVDSSAKNIQ